MEADGTVIAAQPQSPLDPETDYQLLLAAAIADPSGNTLAADVTANYRTAGFEILEPVDGARLVEGQPVTLRSGSPVGADLGIDRVRYFFGGAAEGETDSPGYSCDRGSVRILHSHMT